MNICAMCRTHAAVDGELYCEQCETEQQFMDGVSNEEAAELDRLNQDAVSPMAITRKSPFSGKTNTMMIRVTQEQIDAWHAGALIQNAMPNLTADEREFIMTGITSAEWEEAFGDVS